MSIEWIRAQRDSASDDGLLIARLLLPEGTTVKAGTPIVEVEGSKSLFEIAAPVDGLVYLYANEGEFVTIGAVIACVCTAGEDRPEPVDGGDPEDQSPIDLTNRDRFSDAAWELVIERGLHPESVRPDLNFVTAADMSETTPRAIRPPLPVKGEVSRIALLGGSFGATLAYEALLGNSQQSIVGLFDDSMNLLEAEGIPTLGDLSTGFIEGFKLGMYDACLIVVQADMKTRIRLRQDCQAHGIPLAKVIHPKAIVSRLASIGSGSLILDGARIGPYAQLKENVFVSGLVNIDHHCQIGSDVTFGPGVFLSGGVSVGEACNFGTSIGVESHVAIGSNSTITSGSILHSDVPPDHVTKLQSTTVVRPKR